METSVYFADITDPENPVLIPALLHMILDYIPPVDLLSCRGVCSLWRNVATSLLAGQLDQLSPVTFKTTSVSIKNSDRSKRSIKINKNNVSDCLEYLDSEDYIEDGPLPFSSFYFNMVSLKDLCVQDFLTVFGENITKLKLNLDTLPRKTRAVGEVQDCMELNFSDSASGLDSDTIAEFDPQGDKFCDSETFRRLLLEQCTNLQQLVILGLPMNVAANGFLLDDDDDLDDLTQIESIKIYHKSGRLAYSSTFVKHLFRICPNLENIGFHSNFCSGKYLTDYDRIFCKALPWIENAFQLTDITLSFTSRDTLDLLLELKTELSLKRLSLGLITTHFALVENRLVEFLNEQSDTLEYLSLGAIKLTQWHDGGICYVHRRRGCKICLRTGNHIRFPDSMPALKVLKFTVPVNRTKDFARIMVPRINLTEQFPSLEALWLPESCANNSNNGLTFFTTGNVEPHEQLEWLQFKGRISETTMIQIGTLFPHLKILHLGFQLLPVLQKIWSFASPCLEELIISLGWNKNKVFVPLHGETPRIDSLFTGFTNEQLHYIKTDGKFELRPILPSITNLKSLKRLTIWNESCENCANCSYVRMDDFVSDISVKFAFAKLPRLEFLHVDKEHQISNVGKRILRETMGLTALELSHHSDKRSVDCSNRIEMTKIVSFDQIHPYHGRIQRELRSGIRPRYQVRDEDFDVKSYEEKSESAW